ncbi:MAG: hypothetical protein IKC36_06210 [Clostridia bacterium]|nr:hypothetical protein [Clostridia bacterium]
MEARRKVASIEEFIISLQAEVIEEAAVAEEVVAPVEQPVEYVAPIVEEVIEEAAIVEEAVEEPVYEEPAYEPVEEIVEQPVEAPKPPRAPAKAFDFKIVTADEITQDRYNELKNCAMQYKKLKSRVSKKFDSINSGRTQFVKFGLAGRTLKVYLNLKLEDTDPKFHCKDQSFKKPYVQVPVLIRVKSGRAVKYAKRLIAQCADYVALKPNPKYVPQDYILQMEEIYKANQEKEAAGIVEDEAAVTEEE